MNKLLDAMKFRHACKIFDECRNIEESDFADILESARLSPSSMGMEPTRILVIRDKNLRYELKKACWDQVQVTSCSELVVLKTLLHAVHFQSNYAMEVSFRRAKNEKERNLWMNRYRNFLESMISNGISVESWTSRQSYIVASSMMNMAAFLGIDSCPMEGFDRNMINKILNIDTFNESVSLLIAFGYRMNPQPAKYRIDISDMVEYI